MNRIIRRRQRWSGVLAIGVFAMGSLVACGGGKSSDSGGTAGSGEPYKIGVALALTGPAGNYGSDSYQVIKKLVEDVNATGGVKGRKIELLVEDTKSDPTEAARIATKLIRGEGVMAMIAGTTSADGLAILPQAGRAGVLVLTHGSANELADPNQPWFPTTFRIVQAGAVDIDMARDRMLQDGQRKVAVLFQEDARSTQGAKYFSKLVAEPGGIDIVDQASAASTATDLSAQVAKILQAKPDAVFLNMSVVGLTSAALRALDNAGYKGGLYATAGVVQDQLLKAAGGSAEGLVAGALINPDDPAATPKLFELMKPLGGIHSFGHFSGAQSIAVLLKGLEAEPTDGKSLAAAIEKAGPIEGYGQGPVEYTEKNHNGVTPDAMVVVQVKDGKFVTLH